MTFCQEVFRGFVQPHDLNPQQPFGCTEKNRHKFFHILDMRLVNHVDDIIVAEDAAEFLDSIKSSEQIDEEMWALNSGNKGLQFRPTTSGSPHKQWNRERN